jgi:hypothetical protein
LAGQIKALIQTPSFVEIDYQTKVDTYKRLAEELFNIDTEQTNEDGLNVFTTKELATYITTTTIAEISLDADLQTQSQAVDLIDEINEFFNAAIINLDTDQNKFINSNIEDQYISFLETYSVLVNGIYLTLGFLLKNSFDLAVEKRFFLKKPRAPIEICMNEYKDIEFLDFFIATNKLKDLEIMLLPVGKEIVVYLERV